MSIAARSMFILGPAIAFRARRGSGFFRHRRRVVTRNQPLLAVPFVGVGIAGPHDSSRLAECECVQSGVERRVAVDLNDARVDSAERLVFEKVMEVVLLVGRRKAWLVRDGRKKDRSFGVVRGYLMRVAGLQRLVPSIEKSGDLLLIGLLATLGAGRRRSQLRRLRRARGDNDHGESSQDGAWSHFHGQSFAK